MTTSFDTDTNAKTIAADSNTHTAASAWASSPLGQPDHEVGYGFAPESDADADRDDTRRRPVAKHGVIAAALACGIAGGAALGLMFFDVTPHQPAVTVPGTPGHAVVVTDNPAPSAAQPAPSAVNAPAPVTVGTAPAAPKPANPPAPASSANPQPTAPESQQDPQEPAAEPPDNPQDPDPQPPKPPLVVDDFKPQPQPEPDPEPPVFQPDLPLTLAPKPAPEPDPGPPIFLPPLKLAP